jgi:acyl-CoA synthetase (AMP-forming)/AMP-acid ligase II
MSELAHWGSEIVVEKINGVPFRMYKDRPRRVESLLSFADRWPDRAYIIQGDRTLTRRDLQRESAAKAQYLLRKGVKRGDRVFVLGWNGPDWVLNFWACLRIGAVPVLANSLWSEAEVVDAIEVVQPAMILADRHGTSKLTGSGWPLGTWGMAEDDLDTGLLTLAAKEATDLSENDPVAIIFTSGTSGRFKAVQLAHRSLLSNQMMILHVTRNLPYVPDETAGDVGLHTGPLFHIGGLHALIRGVLIGNTLVFGTGRFDAGDAIRLIERHKIVRWSAVPTMATRILEHPDLGQHDVSSLTAMTLGGSPVTAEFFERVRKGLPSVQARIATGYGLSENAGQATTASGKDTIDKPGTCGRAMPLVEIRSVPVPGLPDGELLIRSPTQMLRYYGADESPIDSEGWLHTGDLGKIDEDGFVWITGRLKEIIIRGGENIAPAAVEGALTSLPGVSEAVVFGVPHAEFGEEVMAVVVVDGDQTADELKTKVRERLASFAVPSLWRIQKEPLPVNQTGKIDKTGLRSGILAEWSAQKATNAASEPASSGGGKPNLVG